MKRLPLYFWLFAYCPEPLLPLLKCFPRRWRARQIQQFLTGGKR